MNEFEERATRTIQRDDIPVLYFNTFVITTSFFDMCIILECNTKPRLILNCSHEAAKQLSKMLADQLNPKKEERAN